MKVIIALFAAAQIGGAAFAQGSENVIERYLNVKDALVISDTRAVTEEALLLQQELEASASSNDMGKLLKFVEALAKSDGIDEQRTAFEDVSTNLWKYLKRVDGTDKDLYYMYCPMKKAYWVSGEAEIKNPYYGSEMLTCGSIVGRKSR